MIVPIIVFLVLVTLFGLTYMLNKKTPEPEGCEKITESCEGCQIQSCPRRMEKKKDEI